MYCFDQTTHIELDLLLQETYHLGYQHYTDHFKYQSHYPSTVQYWYSVGIDISIGPPLPVIQIRSSEEEWIKKRKTPAEIRTVSGYVQITGVLGEITIRGGGGTGLNYGVILAKKRVLKGMEGYGCSVFYSFFIITSTEVENIQYFLKRQKSTAESEIWSPRIRILSDTTLRRFPGTPNSDLGPSMPDLGPQTLGAHLSHLALRHHRIHRGSWGHCLTLLF